jgi:hypothetical protein
VRRVQVILAVLSAGAVLVACGSGNGSSAAQPSTPAPSASSPSPSQSASPTYQPTITPSDFSTTIDNKYFPLKPGTTYIFDGTRDGKPEHAEAVVTSGTKMIMGVKCVVVRDTVTSNGALVEKTTDWYAQASNGDVWYFGEATAEYTNGAVSSTHGSWEAGVDGAQPGIIMEGRPKVGDSYRQEYRPGEAEDMAKVLHLDATRRVPAGSYTQVVVTEDTDPLNPDKSDQKFFGPGVGLIYTERIRTGHHEVLHLVKIA